MERICLGVDPSSTTIGLAVSIEGSPCWSDTFVTDRKLPLYTNLFAYYNHLDMITERFGTVKCVAIEQLSVSLTL